MQDPANDDENAMNNWDATQSNYRYCHQLASRWGDCDSSGHVNNAVYHCWFDTTLTTMLIARGMLRSDARNAVSKATATFLRSYISRHGRYRAPARTNR